MNARHKGVAKVWLLNLFGGAALLGGVYLWLTMPDAHGWQVAASALLAVALVFFGLWLRVGSFAYFRVGEFRDSGEVWRAFRHSVRHMVAFLVWTIPFAGVEWLLYACMSFVPQFGVWWWQKAPALRFGSPRAVSHAAEWVLLIVMVLLGALWLPLASTVAAVGFKQPWLGRSWRLLRMGSYWLWLVLLVIVGGCLPYKIVWWIPELSTLAAQGWSAGLRLALAYTLVISAWVSLLLVIGDRLTVIDPIPPQSAK
jgi:hypothetical protein